MDRQLDKENEIRKKEQHEGECEKKHDEQHEEFKKILKEGMDNYETTLKDLKDR